MHIGTGEGFKYWQFLTFVKSLLGAKCCTTTYSHKVSFSPIVWVCETHVIIQYIDINTHNTHTGGISVWSMTFFIMCLETGRSRLESGHFGSKFSIMTTQHWFLMFYKCGKTCRCQVTHSDLRPKYKDLGCWKEKILLLQGPLNLKDHWVWILDISVEKLRMTER